MSQLQEIKEIEDNVKALYEESIDEFDAITRAFSILTHGVALLKIRFGGDALKSWAAEDSPKFYRFGSLLRIFLEAKRDYLISIESSLVVDENIVSERIQGARQRIKDIEDKKGLILHEGKPLFEMEEELIEKAGIYDALSKRLNTLKQNEEKLRGVDLEAIKRETLEKEENANRLESDVQKLTQRQSDVSERLDKLTEAREGLSQNIDSLDTAYGEEALALSESLPLWIQKVGELKAVLQEKDRKYVGELENEAHALKQIEQQVQDHLQKLNEAVGQAMEYKETLRSHFGANRDLSEAFATSLGEIRERIAPMSESIEQDLQNYDRTLGDIHKRVQGMAKAVQRIGVGG